MRKDLKAHHNFLNSVAIVAFVLLAAITAMAVITN